MKGRDLKVIREMKRSTWIIILVAAIDFIMPTLHSYSCAEVPVFGVEVGVCWEGGACVLDIIVPEVPVSSGSRIVEVDALYMLAIRYSL